MMQVPSTDQDVEEAWKRSPFAVGPSKLTWADEGVGYADLCRGPLTIRRFTSCLCAKLGAGRVGHMVVLRQTTDARTDRPRLLCVLGPFWPVLFCITIPAFVLIQAWVVVTQLPRYGWIVIVLWSVVGTTLFLSLFCVSCRDPGVLYRHSESPPHDDWVWNDQALTYRPNGAKYDAECGLVVEKFDHTCPWTGTVSLVELALSYYRIVTDPFLLSC
jgi:hypothetical protein